MNPPSGSPHDRPTAWKPPLYPPLPHPSLPNTSAQQPFSSTVPSNYIRRRTPYDPSRTWSPVDEGPPQTFEQNLSPPFGFGAQQNQRLPLTHQPAAPPPTSPSGPGPSRRRSTSTMNYPAQYGSHYPHSQQYQATLQHPQHYVTNPSQFAPPTFYNPFTLPPGPQTHRNLIPEKCRLEITQQPGDGAASAASATGKEKSRRPLDPPPIVELIVDDDMDPAKLYMNTPNLFCMIHLVPVDSEEPHRLPDYEPAMQGTLCSSIHRLKGPPDATGKPKESGYFIFGDVMVKTIGQWRLRFTLYDISFEQPHEGFDGRTTTRLATTFSRAFTVHQATAKEAKILRESTELTKGFADQGVRLRLKKEVRPQSSKRRMGHRSPSDDAEAEEVGSDKRQRFDDFTDHTEFSAGPVQPLTDTAQFPSVLGDITAYPAGAVQPSPLYTNYNPIMTNNLQSRYQERVQEQYHNMLNGSTNHFSTYPL